MSQLVILSKKHIAENPSINRYGPGVLRLPIGSLRLRYWKSGYTRLAMSEDRPHHRPPREFRSLPPRGLDGFQLRAGSWSVRRQACGRRRDSSDLKDERPGTGRSAHTDRRSAGEISIPDWELLRAEEPVTAPPAAASGTLGMGNKTLLTALNLGRCIAMLSAELKRAASSNEAPASTPDAGGLPPRPRDPPT
jgi:hypothetical protein